MSTVKISELPEINHLNTDTNQTLALGVDLLSGVTGKMTLKTLAEGLFSNDALKVGNNQILFDNTIGQFSGNSSTYLQINLQNFDNAGCLKEFEPYTCIVGADAVEVSIQSLPSVFPEVGDALLINILESKDDVTSIFATLALNCALVA